MMCILSPSAAKTAPMFMRNKFVLQAGVDSDACSGRHGDCCCGSRNAHAALHFLDNRKLSDRNSAACAGHRRRRLTTAIPKLFIGMPGSSHRKPGPSAWLGSRLSSAWPAISFGIIADAHCHRIIDAQLCPNPCAFGKRGQFNKLPV